MPRGVFNNRVRSINVFKAIFSTVAVVGQREVNLSGVRINGAPLRAVHRRSACDISGQTGIHQNVGLILETVKLDIANHGALSSCNLAGKLCVFQVQCQPVT